jgi:hypothetical protein
LDPGGTWGGYRHGKKKTVEHLLTCGVLLDILIDLCLLKKKLMGNPTVFLVFVEAKV